MYQDGLLLHVREDFIEENKELSHTWVGVASCSDSSEIDIKNWMTSVWGATMNISVRRLSPVQFWIVVDSNDYNRCRSLTRSQFSDGPLKRLDKWSADLGLGKVIGWVRIFGIPLHAWRKEILWKLGGILGFVEEVDNRWLNLEVVEFLQVKIIRPVTSVIPKTLSLEIGDVRFDLWTAVEAQFLVAMEDLTVRKVQSKSDPPHHHPIVLGSSNDSQPLHGQELSLLNAQIEAPGSLELQPESEKVNGTPKTVDGGC